MSTCAKGQRSLLVRDDEVGPGEKGQYAPDRVVVAEPRKDLFGVSSEQRVAEERDASDHAAELRASSTLSTR
jgi:hypothetical protein